MSTASAPPVAGEAADASRLRAAATWPRRILGLAGATTALAFGATAVAAPVLLRIPAGVAGALLVRGTLLAAIAVTMVVFLSAIEVARHRWLLRSLAIGSRAIESADLEHLADVPRRLTVRLAAVGFACGVLVAASPFRPERLDGGRALSLGILVWSITAAACIPFVVLARAATSELFEIAPLEPLAQLVERIPPSRRARLRGQLRLLASLLVPVALAGLGGGLATHAHLRSLVEESRTRTAIAIARAALEPLEGDIDVSGRREAARIATSRGFAVAMLPLPLDLGVTEGRADDGRVVVGVPLDDGRATFVFATPIPTRAALVATLVALSGVAIAAVLAILLARALARDLHEATERMARLGTERVLSGTAGTRRARFAVVAELERATLDVAARFRVFAAAQERALEVREAARRTRGLLFASVSHDLKSPLNAILGFADLIDSMELEPDQRESLDIVRSRGRELLALIETILDAARIEAGQLRLVKQMVPVGELLGESARAARELAAGAGSSIAIDADPDLPQVPVDPTYAARALGALAAHALRASGKDGEVMLRASLTPDGQSLVIDIVHGAPAPPSARERLAMLARRTGPRGRGMALALSLAQRVLELHGGHVEVQGFGDDAEAVPTVRCMLSLSMEAPPRRSVTIPPLSAATRPR